MPTEADLLKLLAWLSPAFPVGAFSYSHGLECAIQDGRLATGDDVRAWIAGLIEHGSGWTDAVLATAAWVAAASGDAAGVAEVAELADALAPSLERRRETLDQGAAFLLAVRAWGDPPPLARTPYPVAFGVTAGAAGLPLQPTLAAWLHAFAANLVSIAVRAVPLGQTHGLAVIAGLEPVILAVATRAAQATLDDVGACSVLSDIAAMRHETLETRLYIS
jgi:urease accessory protein